MIHKEKRRKQKMINPIPVEIKEKNTTFVAQTTNISSSGVYCRTTQPVPLLSKVAITLVVSDSAKGKKSIECKGTIVRTHPVVVEEKIVGYDVAIFFNELSEEDKVLISEHVDNSAEECK